MSEDIYNVKTIDHLVRSRMKYFYQKSFKSFDKNQTFMDSWYIDLLCEYLEALANKEIKRLNINLPPRFGKSALCNVAFSMWLLGLKPGFKIITMTYGARLSEKLHGYSRAIANSTWYRRAFPEFVIDTNSKNIKLDQTETKNTQNQFITTQGGFRLATSVNGSITGEGGELLIFDDMMDPKMAQSEVESENTLSWIRNTAFSRVNNKKECLMLNIQQRLNDKDFTANFVNDTWENVIIPIQARKTKIYSIGDFWKVYKKGEFLEPKRYGKEELEEDRKNMGTTNLNAQFFQETEPDDGEIFKEKWFKYYDVLPIMDSYAIYADTASKEGRENDNSCLMCWGLKVVNDRKYAYLVDVVVGKYNINALLEIIKSFWDKHEQNIYGVPLIKLAIEDQSSGIGIIQILEAKTNLPVVALKDKSRSKKLRALDTLPRFESGQVLLPEDAIWLESLKKEMKKFSPKKTQTKKDQVDTLTYAVKDLLFDNDDNDKPLDYNHFLKNN